MGSEATTLQTTHRTCITHTYTRRILMYITLSFHFYNTCCTCKNLIGNSITSISEILLENKMYKNIFAVI
jgi:hypothetical protein